MPAKSEKQRVMMAIARHHPKKLYKRNRGVLSMSKVQLSEFAHKSGKGGAGGSPCKYMKREGGMGDSYVEA